MEHNQIYTQLEKKHSDIHIPLFVGTHPQINLVGGTQKDIWISTSFEEYIQTFVFNTKTSTLL